mgnify:CR=1 FL=1
MFISLNKKIIYSITIFFFITSIIFVSTFYMIYGNKIQEEQLINIQRNQQYINLLYKNVTLNKELRHILEQNKHLKISNQGILDNLSLQSEENQENLLKNEQKRIAEINESYDKRYNAIGESIKIFGISSILIILSIILLTYLLANWILNPINQISQTAKQVSEGNLNIRIPKNKQPMFTDELDILITIFNQMLDNLQHYISEIKKQEHFLQALVDSIPDGIRVIDKNYNIFLANKAYHKQVGNIGKKCRKCYNASHKRKEPCDISSIHCPLHEILNNQRSNIKVIQQFACHPEKHLSINAAPIQYDGENLYIVESIRDLSEDINFSHQQKLSSLGFLSTSIAHEIKNHLGALRMILERLLDKHYSDIPDDNEEKQQLLLIYNELISSIAVPERLLKLSRTNENAIQDVNCGDAITDILSLLDFEAKSKGININFQPPETPCLISGNEADFKMAAINLTLNAIKAMDANGTLTIKIEKKAQTVNISFSDTGIGIPPENINRIFEPFFSDGRENRQKGNGLGLSITKTIVENFGGSINVESRVGVGSCFTLSFPPIKNLAKKKL